MELQQTPVLVTGAGSGLGAATSRYLASQGARVALPDINLAAAQTVAAEIGAIAIHCDVTGSASGEQAVFEARAVHGPARMLVNVAGGGVGRRVFVLAAQGLRDVQVSGEVAARATTLADRRRAAACLAHSPGLKYVQPTARPCPSRLVV